MTAAPIQRLQRTKTAPMPGIVHLGLGAFFRAHGAVYLQEVMEQSEGDWGVIGVSLRSSAVRDRLAPQDWAYTALELSEQGLKPQVVNTVAHVLVAPEDPDAVLAAMSAATTRIVSLTVTEKGYCRSPDNAAAGVDLNHSDIQHDLNHPLPTSAPGFIVRALQRRWQQDLPPFTVLSLDNLPGNGRVTRDVVLALAAQIDERLKAWIAAECRFPCTMVDRIVPATTEALIERAQQETGFYDPAVVAHEPYRQWVIEDDFVDEARPDFAAAGVEMVRHVAPFEAMKLRMLNGTHSALAYMGSLAGHVTVRDAISDPVIEEFIDGLWREEIAPSLTTVPAGTDLGSYAAELKMRYQNPEIRHLLKQIAADGSEKLPQRILDPLFENRAAGRPCDRLLTVLAAWFRFLEREVAAGDAGQGEPEHRIDDPLAPQIAAAIRIEPNDGSLTEALLSLTSVFGGYPVSLIRNDLKRRVSDTRF